MCDTHVQKYVRVRMRMHVRTHLRTVHTHVLTHTKFVRTHVHTHAYAPAYTRAYACVRTCVRTRYFPYEPWTVKTYAAAFFIWYAHGPAKGIRSVTVGVSFSTKPSSKCCNNIPEI